ncbi:hypothetical protein HZC08_01880 [Candidatus Micrarchaeota archaeon]|nr:hypothetical protein [Candidatus Micrarchaeota archaeon]
MAVQLFTKFRARERHLAEQLGRHSFFRQADTLTDQAFKDYLVQRMRTSEVFVDWYRLAAAKLSSADAKKVVQSIINDERPVGRCTHFEDLLADLRFIGISNPLSVLASVRTVRIISDQTRILDRPRTLDTCQRDLEILVILKIAGETLVAAEYAHVVRQLERRFGLTREVSRFYWPHLEHDSESGNHSRRFDEVLRSLITDQLALGNACNVANDAARIRMKFFDQF